ncbi:DASH complex subunit Dad1-domain-containing protein [Kockovaella imperatae]|uniref:DASH complex subunit DAD1 n=1 Tax=Kockovaella imperatae TaxID=4999 RepID=A0A1Y1UMG8_9TREE|nr:DASH complex subunit Dad1-domain-containing protein [Kockovaella imperatae]ORX38684.1 DASH complex subunit Dad1-domain-containing protein [Kockovaella imperatae]
MSLARRSIAVYENTPEEGFFEREKAKLIDEISSSFEELMTHTNVLNRKHEEVYGVGKEFKTVAELWGTFNALIRKQQVSWSGIPTALDKSLIRRQSDLAATADVGVPGTGSANFGASVNQPMR